MNNRRISFLSIVFIAISFNVLSQTYQQTPTGVKTTVNSVGIEVQFFDPQIVRIVKYPGGASLKKESLVATASPQKIPLITKQEKGALKISSKSLQVIIDEQTGAINF
jgi:alpha-D-xyloside xylohydrolase